MHPGSRLGMINTDDRSDGKDAVGGVDIAAAAIGTARSLLAIWVNDIDRCVKFVALLLLLLLLLFMLRLRFRLRLNRRLFLEMSSMRSTCRGDGGVR